MSRRRESAELAAAREPLHARFESKQAAVAGFFDAAAQLADLREALCEVEVEQLVHAAALSEALEVAAASSDPGGDP